ncbi:MAG TPA: ankyrin repeat domain-containing protein [Streptosporangiaceae bacterium]
MKTVPLPDRASLTQLRKQARDLQRAVRAGSAPALAEVAGRCPAGVPDPAAAAAFPLHTARLVVSRRYGFASWTRLKRHVEVVGHYTRMPPVAAGTGAADRPAGELGDEFLRLACLWYEDDQPERWAQARQLLAARPGLTRGHVHAAAAVADVPALRAILAADPGAARREGGPYRAEPLYYLAYARHDPQIIAEAVLTSARLLLTAGGDPNAGYLWRGLPTPFTVLTGVFGEGELGPDRQPPHPHAQALARLLLESGANPNDGQALYNRMFEPGHEHLELLLEFGLGTGDGGPWRERLGDALGSPAELARGELDWAITHGLDGRVRLLARHGVDLTAPGRGGLTPAQRALTTGHAELLDVLAEYGAGRPELDPADEAVAALLAGDRGWLDRVLAGHPEAGVAGRAARPGLIVWAAVLGRAAAVELIAGQGFDVNAKARTDRPGRTEWETALHQAAQAGDLALARQLTELGADPDVRDARFGLTPLGWARHFGHPELIAFLEPLTSPEPDPGPEVGPGPG